MWWFHLSPWPWILVGPAVMILFVLACMAIVFFVLRTPLEDTALDILKSRFARGEIEKAEYEARRRVLTS